VASKRFPEEFLFQLFGPKRKWVARRIQCRAENLVIAKVGDMGERRKSKLYLY